MSDRPTFVRRPATRLATLAVAALWGAALLAGAACGNQVHPTSSTAATGPPADRPGTMAASGGAPGSAPTVAGSAGDSGVPQGPKVVRDARLTIETQRRGLDAALDQIFSLITTTGGYVSGNTTDASGDQRSASVTFKVPADRFQAAVDGLRHIGTLRSLTVSGDDVSGEYVDLRARLANAEAQRDAMLALLQQAHSIQDILTVRSQLTAVTDQVERLKGRIAFLDAATAMSTLSVQMREAPAGAAAGGGDDWGLATALAQAAHGFATTAAWLIVAVGATGPFLLLAGAAALVLWRRRQPGLAATRRREA